MLDTQWLIFLGVFQSNFFFLNPLETSTSYLEASLLSSHWMQDRGRWQQVGFSDVSKPSLNKIAQLSAVIKLDKRRQKSWGFVCDELWTELMLLQVFPSAWECCTQSTAWLLSGLQCQPRLHLTIAGAFGIIPLNHFAVTTRELKPPRFHVLIITRWEGCKLSALHNFTTHT